MSTAITHWINGQPYSGASQRTANVFDPATGKVSGAIEYSEIEIERGGQFRGEMKQVGIKTFG